MEDTKKQEAGQDLSNEQAADVSGGTTTCSTTATVGTNGASMQTSAPTPGDALISIYDGLVDATSHVIETVVHSTK